MPSGRVHFHPPNALHPEAQGRAAHPGNTCQNPGAKINCHTRLLPLLAGLVGIGLVVGAWGRWNRPAGPSNGRVPFAYEADIWRTRHAEFVAAKRAGDFDVICLGDSLTWGWDDHRDLWAARVTARPTAFFAIGGETTNGLLWRVDHGELDGPPPKLVTILIGTNNRWVKDDAEDIAGGIMAVVARVRERVPTAKVLLLGVLPQDRWPRGSGRRVFAAVNKLLLPLDDGRAVFVRDIGGCLLEPDGELAVETSEDGTHLTRAGYERLAAALGPEVRSLLGE